MTEQDIEERIYSTFASVASSIGYNEVHGRIIAALLVSDKPLALQELSKKTKYSLAAISLSLDLLELVGIVKKFKNPSDRNIYVKLDGDLLEGLRNAMLIKIQKEIYSTQAEFSRYKKIHQDKQTIQAITKLEREISRLEQYLDALTKVKIPQK